MADMLKPEIRHEMNSPSLFKACPSLQSNLGQAQSRLLEPSRVNTGFACINARKRGTEGGSSMRQLWQSRFFMQHLFSSLDEVDTLNWHAA